MSVEVMETAGKPELKDLARRTVVFDWALSMMTAVGCIVTLVVLWLAAVWLTNQVWRTRSAVVNVDVMEITGDGEEGRAGDDPDRGEDALEVSEDATPAEEMPTTDAAEVTEVISNVLDAITANELDPIETKKPEGKSQGKEGRPGGTGLRGTGEGGGKGLPRALRWSIVYANSQSEDAYAKQLDYFGIELGVVRASGQVTYVSNLSQDSPVIRKGGSAENRLYFIWKDGNRKAADLALLKNKAKITADNATVVQFFPPKLEDTLAQLERAYAGKKPEQIQMTRYGIKRTSNGYEFYVMSQNSTG